MKHLQHQTTLLFGLTLSDLRIGCCGWREAKAKYFSHFAAVELQDTFYNPPSLELAAKWRNLAPNSFQFCIKAWQLITHQASSPTYRRLKNKLSPSEYPYLGLFQPTEQVFLAWERTAAIARELRAKVILFQCPKSFEPVAENIRNFRAFFSQIERGNFQLAWEPRGEWSDAVIRDLCAEFDLLHCVDPFERKSVYGKTLYWRLHGRGGYRYKYSDEELAQIVEMKKREEERVASYIFFNNVWMREDALRFKELISSSPDRMMTKPLHAGDNGPSRHDPT